MTTLQIDTNDMVTIEEIKKTLIKKFNIKVEVMDKKKSNIQPKTKWADFAEKMDGIFTPDIIEHINNSRKEARDNFIVNS